MQKKLIALAITAAFSAPAFAETTVYGIVDAAVANSSATGKKTVMQVISGGLSTSRVGIKHTQDLDNGMKGIAVVEYALDVAIADGIGAARQEYVGLSGGFGTVALGYLQHAGYSWAVKFDPTAGSALDSVKSVNPSTYINTSGRSPRAIDYTSPNFSGLTVQVSHGFNQADVVAPATGATTLNLTSVNVLNVGYDSGPLAVGVAYAGESNDNTGFVKNTDMSLGGSFDLEVAKLYGTYQSHKTSAAGVAGNADKGISFSVVAPVGPGSVVGTFGNQKKSSTTATDDTKAFTVAYLYNLSKMTTAYGGLQKVSVNTVPSKDTTTIAVGVRVKF